MPTACIHAAGSRVRLVSERIEVHGRDETTGLADALLREIPIRDLDRLILREGVQISSEALAALLRARVPVSLMEWNGRFLGAFHPASQAHGRWRLRHYQRTLDAEFALQMSGRIVAAKIYNQRRVVQRLAANRGVSLAPELDRMQAILAQCSRCASLDELRGTEGAATARYFQLWAGFLPEAFPFERRSTRPPHNPVNACISFGATLLYQEAVAFIHAHGLDPALGLLHTTDDGRWSLALDLIEPFRPVLVEALALDLFSHGMLGAADFEPHDGGTWLSDRGRRTFFLQYERRMERQFMSESAGHRTTLRAQLEAAATGFKAALESPDRFEPFLMN
jgi:CRISPR-associated protein Cas1